MSPARTLLNLLIIAAGPLATIAYTFCLCGTTVIFHIPLVLILSAIAATASTTVHLKLKHPTFATFISVVASYISYILLLLAIILFSSDAQERTLDITWFWFPITILLLIPYALPLTCTISYGTGRIVRDFREIRSPPPDLPAVLVNNAQSHKP